MFLPPEVRVLFSLVYVVIYVVIFMPKNIMFPFPGTSPLEYVSLAFNHETYLVGLSGVPDFKLTLWDWPKSQMLHTINTTLRVKFKIYLFFGRR